MNIACLKSFYDKKYINNISNCYYDLMHSVKDSKFNYAYFKHPGKYAHGELSKNSNAEELDILKYFNNFVYLPNIYILNHICENINTFQGMTFFDYGSGVGTLSILLKHINIECFNFDNLSQISQDIINLFERTFDINKVGEKIPPKQIDVFCASGVPMSKRIDVLYDCSYLMVEQRFMKKYIARHGKDKNFNFNFNKVISYSNILDIYKKT